MAPVVSHAGFNLLQVAQFIAGGHAEAAGQSDRVLERLTKPVAAPAALVSTGGAPSCGAESSAGAETALTFKADGAGVGGTRRRSRCQSSRA